MDRVTSNKFYPIVRRVGKSGLSIYLMLLLVAFFGQRFLMYPAPVPAVMPMSPRGQLIVLPGANHRRVHAFHIRARDGFPTVVIFHGNAEQLADQVSLAEDFADLGFGAYAIEYPGYGLSSDSRTTEENVYSDAETALRYLEVNSRVPRSTLILYGRSLGTGVAAELAARGFGCRLILVSPYSSMVDLAAKIAPILPVRWLVMDRYNTLAKAPKILQATLIVHGANDSVVPYEMGHAVAARLPQATIRRVSNGDHNDVLAVGGPELLGTILAFIKTDVPRADTASRRLSPY